MFPEREAITNTNTNTQTQIERNHLRRVTGAIVPRERGAGVVFEGDNREEGEDWWRNH